jgi:hypothetical protein
VTVVPINPGLPRSKEKLRGAIGLSHTDQKHCEWHCLRIAAAEIVADGNLINQMGWNGRVAGFTRARLIF